MRPHQFFQRSLPPAGGRQIQDQAKFDQIFGLDISQHSANTLASSRLTTFAAKPYPLFQSGYGLPFPTRQTAPRNKQDIGVSTAKIRIRVLASPCGGIDACTFISSAMPAARPHRYVPGDDGLSDLREIYRFRRYK